MFKELGHYIDALTNTIINSLAVSNIELAGMLALMFLTLYFTIQGYLMISGRIDLPFNKFMLDCAKFLLISGIALNASNYLQFVVGSVDDLEKSLISTFSGKNVTAQSAYASLDESLGKGFGIATKFFELAASRKMTQIGLMLKDFSNGVIIVIGTELLCVVAAFNIIVAKIGLNFMLAIGPIFIFMLMFAPTSKFFDAWLGQTITYLLRISLVLAGFSIATDIFNSSALSYSFDPDQENTASVFSFLGITIVSTMILLELNSVAGNLGGGFASQNMSASQAIRGVMGAADKIGRGTVGATKGAVAAGKGIYKGYRRVRYGKDAINKDK